MASGFAIPTAQAFGAKDDAAVRRSVATGTLLSAAASILITVGGPLLAGPVLVLMRTPTELLAEATLFTQVSFLGAGAMMFFNYLSAIIRAIGDSRTPLVFLTIACALNVVLVVLLVGPVGWGVAGAALATVISASDARAARAARGLARHARRHRRSPAARTADGLPGIHHRHRHPRRAGGPQRARA
jgi:Na+-driven multidrug efflux pump